MTYLWDWWCEFRQMNGEQMDAITIKSWFELQGVQPKLYEISALLRISKALDESRD